MVTFEFWMNILVGNAIKYEFIAKIKFNTFHQVIQISSGMPLFTRHFRMSSWRVHRSVWRDVHLYFVKNNILNVASTFLALSCYKHPGVLEI